MTTYACTYAPYHLPCCGGTCGTVRGPEPVFSLREAERILRRLFRERGIPPSVREFRVALGVSSPRTAMAYLNRLHKAGRIERVPATARGIRLRKAR